jgi:tetratricopeptide (TPR) repeat protein
MAHYNLGIDYGNLDRHQDAAAAYEDAIRLNPNHAEAHYNLGITYSKLGQYPQAVQAFNQAVILKPDFAQAHFNLGIGYLAQGDTTNAHKEHEILKTLDTALADKLLNRINKK